MLSGNAQDIDLLAYKGSEKLALQVKTVSTGSFQYSLNKFIKVQVRDPYQKVLGIRNDLDRNILLVVVFLESCAGKDRFYATRLGDFAQLIEHEHSKYLEKNGGMRPGNNKSSMHGALKEGQLINSSAFSSLKEFLVSIEKITS